MSEMVGGIVQVGKKKRSAHTPYTVEDDSIVEILWISYFKYIFMLYF